MGVRGGEQFLESRDSVWRGLLTTAVALGRGTQSTCDDMAGRRPEDKYFVNILLPPSDLMPELEKTLRWPI